VKQENAFMLTDPSIHCEEARIYGESNLGEEGINEFFKTHRYAKRRKKGKGEGEGESPCPFIYLLIITSFWFLI
jgi:hypothetical protein